MTTHPLTPAEYEARRRRLEADIEDARVAFNRARNRWDGLREELRGLRLDWAEQQRARGERP